MPSELHRRTLGNIRIIETDGNPNTVITAPKGSIAQDKTTPAVWQNTDGATAWAMVPGVGSGLCTVLDGSASGNTGAGMATQEWKTNIVASALSVPTILDGSASGNTGSGAATQEWKTNIVTASLTQP